MNISPAVIHTTSSPIRLLIYAHFDPENKIQDYVRHSLSCMAKICNEIRFVSTSVLPDAEMEKIRPFISEALMVENIGLDFNMWKSSLRGVNLGDFDELVIMNSSIYGPVFDISPMFEEMSKTACDCWGATENYEHDRHLQSYFIVFRKSILISGSFKLFWDSVLPYENKKQIIRSYELGLSQWLISNGFILAAYCPWSSVVRYLEAHPDRTIPFPPVIPKFLRFYEKRTRWILRLLKREYKPINPSVAFPLELMEIGFPFLKVEVLRDNPYKKDLSGIFGFLRRENYPEAYLLSSKPAEVVNGMRSSRSAFCPLCGQPGKIRFNSLADFFRFGSPRSWSSRLCASRDCGCIWLDPMPLKSEIFKAYQTYYTHQTSAEKPVYYLPQYNKLQKLMIKVLHRCLNFMELPKKRETFWLHGLTEKTGGKLLEIGCGDGSRLLALKDHGWIVEGQEIDPKAAENCRSKGLFVHAGKIDELGLSPDSFDVILMSHVLEHLHRPVEFLAECRKLLKPGGKLVLSTPNINSFGNMIYRRNWLPLDPPRHLILYNRKSLANVLRAAGFEQLSVSTVSLNCELIAMHSRDLRYLGWTDMNSMPRIDKELVPLFMQFLAMLIHFFRPGSGEECFAIACKPEK